MRVLLSILGRLTKQLSA